MPDNSNQRAAAIRRAQIESQRLLVQRLNQIEQEVLVLYREATERIAELILSAASVDGVLTVVSVSVVSSAINQVLDDLSGARTAILNQAIDEMVDLGLSPFDGETGRIDLDPIRSDTIQQIRQFAANDGLKLTDRVARVDSALKQRLVTALEERVSAGTAYSQAVERFIGTNDLPQDVLTLRGEGAARAAAQDARNELDGGKQYRAALQIIRTESIRAKGLAHRSASAAHPDIVGMKYQLSPRHPRPDICDLHAGVNRYGLGPGVYPPDRSPWPAHPNTLSFEQVVFKDEITDEDRNGKQSRIDFLSHQPLEMVKEALGGHPAKLKAFQAGLVNERSIATPWATLRKRLITQGVDVGHLEN